MNILAAVLTAMESKWSCIGGQNIYHTYSHMCLPPIVGVLPRIVGCLSCSFTSLTSLSVILDPLIGGTDVRSIRHSKTCTELASFRESMKVASISGGAETRYHTYSNKMHAN